MKYYLLIIVFMMSFCKNRTDDNPPKIVQTYTVEQFYKTTNYSLADFAADENALMINSNQSGIYNGYLLPMDGKEAQPITQSIKESVFMIGYLPDGLSYLYSSNKGGDENDHIFLQVPGAEAKDLSPGDKVKANFMHWAKILSR